MRVTKKRSPIPVILTSILVVLALLIGILSALYGGARLAGQMTLSTLASDALAEKTGVLHYKDAEYDYKDGLRTIALLATDGDELVAAALAALPESEDDPVSLVTVPKDAEAALMVLDEYGAAVDLELAPLSAAYKKDDGEVFTADALSDLFHGVPVCGWISLPLDRLSPDLSDAQDGFDVKLAADEEGFGSKDETVTLNGQDALLLLRQNDAEWPAVLTGYLDSIAEDSEKDPRPLLLSAKLIYDEAETDLSLPQLVYLSSQLFKERGVESFELPLSGVADGNRRTVDVDALYELTIDLFFTK